MAVNFNRGAPQAQTQQAIIQQEQRIKIIENRLQELYQFRANVTSIKTTLRECNEMLRYSQEEKERQWKVWMSNWKDESECPYGQEIILAERALRIEQAKLLALKKQ